jgi:CelD/BcsL family acetyltransferase involved in cellulose biosynthesis
VSSPLTLVRVEPGAVDWAELDRFGDRYVTQTREWIEFVAETQSAEPVVAEVRAGGEVAGYFTGLVVRKFGIPILGSPFPGWSTAYMGFNLREGVSRREALAAVPRFAFESLGCMHVELKDRFISQTDSEGLGFDFSPTLTYEIDLRRSEDELWARFSSACRRAIRKSEKEGVVVEEATDDAFAAEYYDQLRDVFAKQSSVPTYDLARVQALVRHLLPTGRLLLLRARDPDGTCIATAIFPAHNGTAFFWGGASYRQFQILRPNEAVFWYAMRYWKERGMTVLDTGGGGEYKRKYGVTELRVPHLRQSRFRALSVLRNWSQRAVGIRQSVAGRL